MSMNKLNEKDMRLLKENGLVGDTDIVYMMGQTIVAENMQTGAKRIIEAPHLLLECKRQLLRG
tara:strand:- start:1226 stop:1414 length:189 start_codon:yes stop_codon:yes gene_type:complete